MRLAISNIAWDVAYDEQVAELLGEYDIDAIDIAPSKYFPNPAQALPDDMSHVKNWWQKNHIELTGMQALLFGTQGLNVFGPPDVQNAMLSHLAAICRIANALGSKYLVFGSPKNRDRSGLDDSETIKQAIVFFRQLGDIAAALQVVICLEPNPPCYGANFMTNAAETAEMVKKIAHPAIQMQFDTGAMTLTAEDPHEFLRNHADLIGHIHASEPNLVPLGTGSCDHHSMAKAISTYAADKIVTIEMVAPKDQSPIKAISNALEIACKYYRPVSSVRKS